MNELSDDVLKQSNRMNWLLTILLCVVAMGLPMKAKAEVAKVEVIVNEGDYRVGMFAICVTEKDAVEVAEAFHQSEDEADKLLEAKETCAGMPITFVVGEVKFVANLKDGRFVKVVQVFHPRDQNQSMYWITTVTIKKAAPETKKHKPDSTLRRGQNV